MNTYYLDAVAQSSSAYKIKLLGYDIVRLSNRYLSRQ